MMAMVLLMPLPTVGIAKLMTIARMRVSCDTDDDDDDYGCGGNSFCGEE